MLKHIFIAVILLITSSRLAFAQDVKLSPYTEISLLTCDPGEELYSVFGHSAIRVSDPLRGIDKVYNYGTFDFRTPGFYVKFARGKLNYMLSLSSFSRFKEEYIEENRSIYEQQLDLTYEQQQHFFDFLEWNSKPENKYYMYDFFFDNCATRIRDIVTVEYNSKLVFKEIENRKTFRTLINECLVNSRLASLGINIVLGVRTDKVATSSEYMFLPFNLMNAFDSAQIVSNGERYALVKKKNTIFKAKVIDQSKPVNISAIVFWSIFLIVAAFTILSFKTQKLYIAIDRLIYGVTGLLGILILLLWIATDHQLTVNNFNILWAFPLNFFLVFIPFGMTWLKKYFLVFGIIQLLFLVTWCILPQQVPGYLIPLVLTLCIRSFQKVWFKV